MRQKNLRTSAKDPCKGQFTKSGKMNGLKSKLLKQKINVLSIYTHMHKFDYLMGEKFLQHQMTHAKVIKEMMQGISDM